MRAGPVGVLPRQRVEYRRRRPADCRRHLRRRGGAVFRCAGTNDERHRGAGAGVAGRHRRRHGVGVAHRAAQGPLQCQRDPGLADADLYRAAAAAVGGQRAAEGSQRHELPAIEGVLVRIPAAQPDVGLAPACRLCGDAGAGGGDDGVRVPQLRRLPAAGGGHRAGGGALCGFLGAQRAVERVADLRRHRRPGGRVRSGRADRATAAVDLAGLWLHRHHRRVYRPAASGRHRVRRHHDVAVLYRRRDGAVAAGPAFGHRLGVPGHAAVLPAGLRHADRQPPALARHHGLSGAYKAHGTTRSPHRHRHQRRHAAAAGGPGPADQRTLGRAQPGRRRHDAGRRGGRLHGRLPDPVATARLCRRRPGRHADGHAVLVAGAGAGHQPGRHRAGAVDLRHRPVGLHGPALRRLRHAGAGQGRAGTGRPALRRPGVLPASLDGVFQPAAVLRHHVVPVPHARRSDAARDRRIAGIRARAGLPRAHHPLRRAAVRRRLLRAGGRLPVAGLYPDVGREPGGGPRLDRAGADYLCHLAPGPCAGGRVAVRRRDHPAVLPARRGRVGAVAVPVDAALRRHHRGAGADLAQSGVDTPEHAGVAGQAVPPRQCLIDFLTEIPELSTIHTRRNHDRHAQEDPGGAGRHRRAGPGRLRQERGRQARRTRRCRFRARRRAGGRAAQGRVRLYRPGRRCRLDLRA
ncbi:hypothetical protein CBM2634_A80281 [Cupriavidus taiwanensis]|uniref:Uncharacterized protein n=1 Tax=Cupriavidus taiwanensis TaxID=164546 RepID=A0A375J3I7_9BURK|nr:hypothetical protein CBM2634_A80281 [Cupriavidus taiwanensis]